MSAAEQGRIVSFRPFTPRAPWWSGDLQTVRNLLTRAADRAQARLVRWPAKRLWLDTPDGSGDRICCLVQHPEAPRRGAALVLLVHGLGGCEESSYMQTAAADWLERGHSVARLNLRGAGPTRPHCRLQYNGGDTRDLHRAILELRTHFPEVPIVLVGFSLGGGLALRLAGEHAGLPLHALVSVSAPLDLAQTVRRLTRPRNALYHRYMLQKVRAQTLAPGAELSDRERDAIRCARSLIELDDGFVAPRAGFRGAADYYESSSARHALGSIELPTLVIQALDDPWIPPQPYLAARQRAPSCVEWLLPPRGGHLGFHQREARVPWHQECAEHFVDETLNGESATA